MVLLDEVAAEPPLNTVIDDLRSKPPFVGAYKSVCVVCRPWGSSEVSKEEEKRGRSGLEGGMTGD